MVIGRIKKAFEKRRQRKAEEIAEQDKLESYRQSEEMKKAEQIKKEADRLAHLKQYKHAIDEYKKALETFPYNEKELVFKKPAEFFFKVYYNMAASYSYMNKLKDSIEFFDNALKIDNVDADNKVKALMGKGNSYYLGRQLLSVDDTYKTRMDTDFDVDEKTLESLKKLDEKQGLLSLACECFSKAIETDRNHADAWYKKGHMEFLMNQVKEAMLSFDNVLMLDKKYDNKEKIELFDDIKREKGIEVKYSKAFESDLKFKAKTGHMVRNKAEAMIANFLFDNNLIFQYNAAVTWSDKDDFKSTFFIPSLDLYVEHFKYDYIKDYQKLMKFKIKQYEKAKKKLVYTVSEDEKQIEEALKIKLKPYVVV